MSEPHDLTKTTAIVVAHCDDLELGMGGTVAKLADAGWCIHVFVLSSQPEIASLSEAEFSRLQASREAEAINGASVLGIPPSQVHFLRVGAFTRREVVGRIHGVCREAFQTHRPTLPFVFSHTLHDRHSDHVECYGITRQAFRVPMLSFAVATSTDGRFDPVVCVDTTLTFERKTSAFSKHESQQSLNVDGVPMSVFLPDFDARRSTETGFGYSEFFELDVLLAQRDDFSKISPVVQLCDSKDYAARLVAQVSATRKGGVGSPSTGASCCEPATARKQC